MKRQSGVTLLEVLIAVTLLSVLSVGMMMAMRIGISALWKTDQRLMGNRRVAGAQQILQQQLENLIPVTAACTGAGAGPDGPKVSMFSGQSATLTMVSSFSIQGASRGRPQVLQFFTAPSENGGLQLLVNETPYLGSKYGGQLCAAARGDGVTAGSIGQFLPPRAGPGSFVIADRLRAVSFQYMKHADRPEEPGTWLPAWTRADWPAGIRVLLEPLEPNPAQLQPVTVTAPMYVYRTLGAQYEDQ